MCYCGNSHLISNWNVTISCAFKLEKKKVSCLWSVAQSWALEFKFRKQLRHQLDMGSPGF